MAIVLLEDANPLGYVNLNHYGGSTFGDQHENCSSGYWGPTTNPGSHVVANRSVQTLQVIESEASFNIVSTSGSSYSLRIANQNADIIPPARIATTSVPNSNPPNPLVVNENACTSNFTVSWSANVTDPDLDHYLITGGDVPITAPATATSANISITVAPQEGSASRNINIYSVDTQGNVSCNQLDGTKILVAYGWNSPLEKRLIQNRDGNIKRNAAALTFVNAWPSPCVDLYSVELDGRVEGEMCAYVYSIDGDLSRIESDVQNQESSAVVQLRVTELASGFHVVQLISANCHIAIPLMKK
ncbi:MAG: hypothetical protein HYX66_03545 [Ignavibacteria bacterium]|nr:hypothetical protein [Ignavibacteria bacterium]